MKQIVLATRNKDKVRELQPLFDGIPFELVSVEQFSNVTDVEEDQDTLEGNALKKAREVARMTGLPALADDTGLEVHYLNDAPGVYSSRYAGPNATYADNCKKLLEQLRGVPPRRRAARFRCVLALVVAGQLQKTFEGECRGTIIESPRGNHGFGYDPIFLPSGYSKTLAEMDVPTKNTLSHRARAAVQMVTFLKETSAFPPSKL